MNFMEVRLAVRPKLLTGNFMKVLIAVRIAIEDRIQDEGTRIVDNAISKGSWFK